MMQMKELALLLADSMEFFDYEDKDLGYLSSPVGSGSFEVFNDGYIQFTTYDRTGAASTENHLGNVPQDIPVIEQASFIRMFIRKFESQLDQRDDPERHFILTECNNAVHDNREISHTAAKSIAWGNVDDVEDVMQFLTTGAITSPSLWRHMFCDYSGESMYDRMSEEDRFMADALGSYLATRRTNNQTGPVDNWVNLHY